MDTLLQNSIPQGLKKSSEILTVPQLSHIAHAQRAKVGSIIEAGHYYQAKHSDRLLHNKGQRKHQQGLVDDPGLGSKYLNLHFQHLDLFVLLP